MKHKKTSRQPITDIQRQARRVQDYRLPSGPFDYAERTRAMKEASDFFHEIVRACRSYYADPEARVVIESARRLYHEAWEMAYPPGFWEDYERLRAGNSTGLESILGFLEADPYFFRSGYVKARLIRAIKPPMLKATHKARLQAVVLHLVDSHDDRDFRAYCTLAHKVDAPELREELMQRLTHDNPNVRRRARWVLEALGEKVSQG